MPSTKKKVRKVAPKKAIRKKAEVARKVKAPKKRAPSKRLSFSARLRAHAKRRKVAKFLSRPSAPTGKIHPEALLKHHGNPIIEPRPHMAWESKATFNPAAVEVGGNVHLLYRAIGDGDVSVIGHAVSHDGLVIDQRFDEPAYVPELPNAKWRADAHAGVVRPPRPPFVRAAYLSGGGGWGGAEDPRATVIDDNLYLTYTAFDGWGSVRVALAAISVKDFLDGNLLWEKPVFLSPPGEVHKNWVLFPEKIHGKYAILHSISPDILIEYVDPDDLDAISKGEKTIASHYNKNSGTDSWDSWVRGIGPPPIKTNVGWLLLYHAMDARDPNRYKLGAMIVDLDDPTKILYRSRTPVLEPEEWYENTGWKSGVVYACGAIVKDATLFVYYGGADSVVCVATANLDEFVEQLKKNDAAKLVPGPKAMPTKIA